MSTPTQHVALAADRLNEIAEQSCLTAQQIKTVMQSVALGSERQVEGVSSTNISVGEMNTGLEKIADFAVTVDTSSLNAAKEGVEGHLVIAKSMTQMKTIELAFSHTA